MDYIDNVYVINMDKSKDRLSFMQSQIPVLGKSFTRVPGVDGTKLSKRDIARYTDLFCNNFCTYSMIGCFLSHMKCWQSVVDNNDKYALIMEDDTELIPSFQLHLKNVMDELIQKDPEWDFLYAGCLGACKKDKNYDFISFLQSYTAPNIKYKKCNHFYSFIPQSPIGFHCYIITQKCARKLLQFLNKVTYHVDVTFLNHTKHFSVYASTKNLGYQYSNSQNSTQTENFPVLLNSLLKNIKCSKGISYDYYMSAPVASIGSFNINLFLLLFIVLYISIPAPYNLWLLFYFLLEIQYGNLSFILFWVTIILLSALSKRVVIDIFKQ